MKLLGGFGGGERCANPAQARPSSEVARGPFPLDAAGFQSLPTWLVTPLFSTPLRPRRSRSQERG